MCLFSIIVPIYNIAPTFLRRCIESSVKQGIDDMEVLLVDDGSKEYCGDICKEYASRYTIIQYIRQENKGVSVARNVGLSCARGEYIVFLDADDWIPEGFFELISSKIPQDKPDILMYEYGSEYSNKGLRRTLTKKQVSELKRDNIILAMLDQNSIFSPYDVGTIWAKLIKRSIIEQYSIRFPVGVIRGQDKVFMLYLYERCHSLAFISEFGYCYRKNSKSISHRFNPQIIDIDEVKFSEYERFLNSSDIDVDINVIMSNIRVKALLGEYLTLYFCHKDNPKDKEELQQEFLQLIETNKYADSIKNNDISNPMMKYKISIMEKGHVSSVWVIKRMEDFVRRVFIREY